MYDLWRIRSEGVKNSVGEPGAYQLATESVQLGSWRILAELARGGMAAVFLAVRDPPLGPTPEVVAIKQIHAHLAHDPDFVAMLTDEAHIASRINHPNVVEIRDLCLGNTAADNYVVMEYAAGEALSLVLKASISRGIRIDYAVAASMGADVAGGLHAAHELRGDDGRLLEIVHRDVSPQNIILTYDGRIKLTDFGIAKALGRLQRTHPGEIKGKLAYMSPEQAFGRPVDRRSDVYSLGIVLYELCMGRRLFGGKNDAETVKNIMNHVVPPPHTLDPQFPPGLEEILMGMLTQDVNQRFQSAGAVERALRAFHQNAGLTSPEGFRSELVRSLEPARFQAKTALVNRALEQFASARPAVRKGTVPPAANLRAPQAQHDPDEMPTMSLPRTRPSSSVSPVPSSAVSIANPSPTASSRPPPAAPAHSGDEGPDETVQMPSRHQPAAPPRTQLPAIDPLDQTFQTPRPSGLPPPRSKTPMPAPTTAPNGSFQPPPARDPRLDMNPFAPPPSNPFPQPPPPAPPPKKLNTGLLVAVILAVGLLLSVALFALLQLLNHR